jgi:hypothetical protein
MDSKILRVGRGGMGNIFTAKDVDNVKEDVQVGFWGNRVPSSKAQQDIESQDRQAVTEAILASRVPTQYVHSGRGGAGNFVTNTEGVRPSETSTTMPTTAQKPIGRGGVGNIEASRDTIRKSIADVEKADLAKLRDITREVDDLVKPPAQAHLGEGREVKKDGLEE